jgi:hypothetical protein
MTIQPPRWLKDVLARHRQRRRAIEREAEQLLTLVGEMAYEEARNRARASRRRDDRASVRFWSTVAVRIAKRSS